MHEHRLLAHTHAHTQVIYNRVEGKGSAALQGLFWEVEPFNHSG